MEGNTLGRHTLRTCTLSCDQPKASLHPAVVRAVPIESAQLLCWSEVSTELEVLGLLRPVLPNHGSHRDVVFDFVRSVCVCW
jgi:hypothetical protein